MIAIIRTSLAACLFGGCAAKEDPRDDFECIDYSGEDCASVGLPEENLRATCGDCSELWICIGSDDRGYEVEQATYYYCFECITEDGYFDTTPGGPCDYSNQSPD